MSELTDVEISRALNAVATTLRDQRPERLDPARVEQIARGALGGEAKLRAVRTASGCDLRRASDDRLVAVVERDGSGWTLERELLADESSWAIPQPAHDEQKAKKS